MHQKQYRAFPFEIQDKNNANYKILVGNSFCLIGFSYHVQLDTLKENPNSLKKSIHVPVLMFSSAYACLLIAQYSIVYLGELHKYSMAALQSMKGEEAR